VLIFTHNGLFCDWCTQRLPSYKRKAIARWSLETGPQLGEYLSALEHIEQQIATATSPKLLAQAVMNLMDEWLAEARFAYALPVQARLGEEYTLTEIWEPFCARLKEVEKAMKIPLGRLKPLLDAGYPDEKGALHGVLAGQLIKIGRAQDARIASQEAVRLADGFQRRPEDQ